MDLQVHTPGFLESPLAAVLVLAFITTVIYQISQRPKKNLPPGPSGLPVIGNALVLADSPWLKFTEWKREYGPIMHFKAAGTTMVILNDRRVAHELLDQRATETSNRARLIVGNLMTGGLMLPFLNRGTMWRKFHTAIVKWTRVGDAFSYRIRPAVYGRSVSFCKKLLEKPEEWNEHCKHSAISMGLTVVYGTIPGGGLAEKEMTIEAAHDFVTRLSPTGRPGKFAVEIIPWLQYLPRLLTPWKTMAERSFASDSAMFNTWLDVVREEIKRGGERDSIGRSLVENPQLSENEAAWLAAAFVAGSMTTIGALGWFILAMVLYPEVQFRAQAELDRVVGRERLPTFEDYKDMPYMQAMVREILRWRPVDPIGLPHSNGEDLLYRDYFIPKNSILLCNIWAMNRDPEVWGLDAHNFSPERHLDRVTGMLKTATASTHDSHTSFGFGRRICPGRNVANDIIFMYASMVLWSLELKPATDSAGNTVRIDIDGSIDDGLVVRPVPFPCVITPRSEAARSLIMDT